MQKDILGILFLILASLALDAQAYKAQNPVIFADVPDMSMIRVMDTYYMSSTTMHMSPGVPIMRSKDLINWELINYAYDTLADIDALNLTSGKFAYGRGSWASCLNYHQGTFYVPLSLALPVERTFTVPKISKKALGKKAPSSLPIMTILFFLMMRMARSI